METNNRSPIPDRSCERFEKSAGTEIFSSKFFFLLGSRLERTDGAVRGAYS